jgi:hypothetical protein
LAEDAVNDIIDIDLYNNMLMQEKNDIDELELFFEK